MPETDRDRLLASRASQAAIDYGKAIDAAHVEMVGWLLIEATAHVNGSPPLQTLPSPH